MASTPLRRVTAAVDHGEDQDLIAVEAAEDAVGEARQQSATQVHVDQAVAEWVFQELVEHPVDRRQEHVAESVPAGLVRGGSLFDVGGSRIGGRESHGCGRSRLRISSRTSCQSRVRMSPRS